MKEDISGSPEARAPRPPIIISPMPPATFYLPVTITFDNVASGTVVDTAYKTQGVTFASLLGRYSSNRTRAPAFAMEMQIATAESGKNVLSISNQGSISGLYFNDSMGAVEATFSQLQQSASVWTFVAHAYETIDSSLGDNRPYIEAFDANGVEIGTNLTQLGPHDANFFGHWHPLSFSSPSRNIKSIRLSAQGVGSPMVLCTFDTLTFDRQVTLRR